MKPAPAAVEQAECHGKYFVFLGKLSQLSVGMDRHIDLPMERIYLEAEG
jgi:hypothetical protein